MLQPPQPPNTADPFSLGSALDPIAPLRDALREHYDIEREIGQGAFATVYLARDLKHEREVAVKVLHADPTSETGELRFIREIRMLARLQHPNILPLHDSGHVGTLLYYVMPYVSGETLRARMNHERVLSPDVACLIASEVADALAYAHEQGIIHRDIKPENILLSAGHPVLADFGIARVIDIVGVRQLTQTGMGSPGTPAYMSPEQLMGDRTVDPRSDVYSLGCVLYEMLAGRPPFAGKEGFVRRFTEPSPRISLMRQDVPPEIDHVIAKMLERDPQRRYQTAAELHTALTTTVSAHLNPTARSASPPSTRQDADVESPGSRRVHRSTHSSRLSQPPDALSATGPAGSPRLFSPMTGRGLVGAAALGLALIAVASLWYAQHRQSGLTAAGFRDAPESLAVLPFENLGRSDDAYFADGVTEEISGRIGSLSGLRLVGRQSARSYAGTTKSLSQIGKELGVTYVLTGSVRWDRSLPGHDRVRVIPALVRVTDGTQIWSNVSEDELRGIFGLQSKVAEEVAQALKIHLSTAERQVLEARPTQNVEAYDYYLRGMSAMLGLRGSDMMKAVTLLKRATELDPKFALAYVALGVAHTNVFWFVADLRPERLQMAKQAIDRALALDPNLPAAHNALGNYYYHGLLDFERALREFNAVHRLSPNDAEALASKSRIERRQGKWDESIESDRQAILLDPRNINYIYDQGYNLVLTRRYDAADSIARQLIEIDPTRWLGYRLRIHVALLKSGDVKTALGIFREAKDRTDPETFGSDILLFPWPVYLDSSLLEAVRSVRPPSSLLERLVYFQGLGMIALYQGDSVAARAMGDSIVKLAHTAMRGSTLDQDLGEVLAAGHAFRGERAEALTEARKGPRLFPKSRDAIRVADYLIQLGYVATIVGADDEAISAFENTLAMPAFTSSTLLRTDPLLARLRANSRFGRLLVNR